ncbi:hypothetical protein PCANC_05582 [Puccinia coronata f. sp. avenae]|uniref:Uncharacterized protein n=1 Tax=Puccinia coronata f. sp. avenae TaxID=200324 RepID=A0A2N5VP79_9BASI|nr:hypothetical protein PCANC_05582 [Puccinia coronata f. sp. avenae]
MCRYFLREARPHCETLPITALIRMHLAAPGSIPFRRSRLVTYTAARVHEFRPRHLDDTVTQGSLDQPGRPHDSTYGSDTRTELLPPNRRLGSQPRHLGANMTALTSYGHIVVIVTRIACTFNSCKMVGVRMAPAHLYLPAGKCTHVVAMAPDHDQKGRNAGASLTLGCGVSAPVLLTASFVAPVSGRVTGADL